MLFIKPRSKLELTENRVVVLEDGLCPLGTARLEIELVRAGLEDDVAVGGLGIDGDELAGARVPLLCRVEGPEGSGAKHEHLVVDNILAQARSATPTEGVHRVTFAEVGVPGKGLLESGPARLEVTFGAEVFTVGVLGGNAVDSPGAAMSAKGLAKSMRGELNIPFACKDNGVLLDLDAAELVVLLGLVRNTCGSC